MTHRLSPRARSSFAATVVATVLLLIGSLLTAPAAFGAGDKSRGPVVVTEDGPVRGIRMGDAQAFLGIPYAAPPVKDLRFAAPAPVEDWTGTRDATRQAPACVQFQPGGVRETQPVSEDCLYLDVYRPKNAGGAAKLPVIVWVHGGGLTQGAGVIYGGQTLAAITKSIVVTVNYRVGPLGYLSLAELDQENPAIGSGNWGVLDQIAALQWVQQNASAFGGNPDNVTLAGQSAGAASVCALLASPLAAGLFHRATIQSAFCGLLERSLADAQTQDTAFADEVGCTDAATRVACLRRAWAPSLVSAFQSAPGGAGIVFGTPVLPAASADAIAADDWNSVPIITGVTAHEGKLFFSANPDITAEQYEEWLAATYGASADQVGARYPLSEYPSPFYAQSEVFGDQFFYCANERTADLLATKTTVFRYEFSDPDSPTLYGLQPEGVDMSSTHSAELAYLFDFTLGDAPIPDGSRELATLMKQYWGSFAEDGDPNERRLPIWPEYLTDDRRTLVLAPDGPRIVTDAGAAHNCDLWGALAAAP
jgi:para-nitrobenzyl esterase